MSERTQAIQENRKVKTGESITIDRLKKEQISVIAEAVIEDVNDWKEQATSSQIRLFLTGLVSIRYRLELEKDELGRKNNENSLGNNGEEDLPLGEEIKQNLDSLKIRLVYQGSRGDGNLKNLMKKANLVKLIDMVIERDSVNSFYVFANYVEALVAYHKYYIPRKNQNWGGKR